MSVTEKYRYCIPYIRKDSPNEGSTFSSILYTIVLTILYFYNKKLNKYILEDKDIILAYSNKKLFNSLIRIYNIDEEDLNTVLYRFRKMNINDIPAIPVDIMKEYLKLIFSNYLKSDIVLNCSFIDIINHNVLWQVGYSGTVNIDFNIEPIKNIIKYNTQVIKDPDEQINVQNALQYHRDVLYVDSNDINGMFYLFIN